MVQLYGFIGYVYRHNIRVSIFTCIYIEIYERMYVYMCTFTYTCQ